MREIILDTETTGLDPKQGHRVIEIGCLEMSNKVLTQNKFHYYINPEREVPAEAFNIHGISTQFLRDKPKFNEIAESFLEFIKGATIVIHNAAFDLSFLNFELSLLQLPSLDSSKVIDTLALARKMYPGRRNNLDALCERLKIDNSHREYHGALKDAKLLSEIYIELTGGRQTTLEINNSSDLQNNLALSQNKISAHVLQNLSLKVYKPTAEEIAAHSEFLNSIPGNLWSKYSMNR